MRFLKEINLKKLINLPVEDPNLLKILLKILENPPKVFKGFCEGFQDLLKTPKSLLTILKDPVKDPL